MADRGPDYDRDWSYSGADYDRYGRERGFRRPDDRSSWRGDREWREARDARDERDARDTRRDWERGGSRSDEEYGGRFADLRDRPDRLYGEYPRNYAAGSPPPYWMRDENPRQGFGLPEHDRERYGRFYGRGPKGYRRSDERIREDISDRLMSHPDIDASDIEVRVAEGIVTLSGLVEDRHEKRIVEYIAEDVLGVEDVRNEMKVRHGLLARLTGEHASDRELRREPAEEAGSRGAQRAPTRSAGRATGVRSNAR